MRRMLLARRRCTTAAAIALVVAAGCGDRSRAPTPAGCPGSTLRCTLVDPGNAGTLQIAPGEPLLDRVDLAPAGAVAEVVLTFAQISDAHVTDTQSPLRVEAIDPVGGAVSSAFRPQEALTAQVLAAIEPTIDALHPAFVLESGDLIDNAQENELGWALTTLRGGTIRPDSGRPGYDGVQAALSPNPFLYRPDVDQPRHPGLLEAAVAPFQAGGLKAPWLPLISNHDILVQGNVPVDAALAAIATGSSKLVVASPEALDQARRGSLDPSGGAALLGLGAEGRSVEVPADPARRLLAAPAVIDALETASGVSADPAMKAAGLLAYHRLVAPGIVVVALDTATRGGGADGAIPPAELAWLRGVLGAAGDAHLLVVSPTPLESTSGGPAVLALLDATPGVVAVLAGDTHRSLVTPRSTASGGYWLVRTPSLVDYPQQARAFQLVRLADGRLALDTWLLDHAGADGAAGYLGLAGIARALAELDYQGGRPHHSAGGPLDRNVRLFLP